MVALKHSSTNIPLSMSQEVYLLDESSEDFNDIEAGNDDNDGLLFESAVGSDIIDFGSRHQHEEDITEAVYNPYDMIIPRAKELVSIVSASKNCRERGVAIEEALNNLISKEKENLASEKPPPRGGIVSVCPVGKVKKTKVSGWCN